MEGNVSGLI